MARQATALALVLLEQDAGLDFGGVFQLAFFVIFFNILSSFYWSGKYFILTGYKPRLLLNIGWVYLLENSCLVRVAVESQVIIICTEAAVPGDESMGNHSEQLCRRERSCSI